METEKIDIEKLKEIIEDSVAKAIKKERRNMQEVLMPEVGGEEMDDIIEKYGENSDESDFTDMTDWVNNESRIFKTCFD